MKTPALNRKILLIVIGLTVFSQLIYLYVNVRAFQRGYLDGVRNHLQIVGMSLKEDLDFILGKRIPIHRLFGLQKMLHGLLADAMAIEAIAIHDHNGRWLYYCDRQAFIQSDGSPLKAPDSGTDADTDAGRGSEAVAEEVRRFATIAPDYKLTFPLVGQGRTPQGTCVLVIDQDHIRMEVKDIALDSVTIILISILATIDFVFFIVAYTITLPIRHAVCDIACADERGSVDYPVRRTGIDFLDQVLIRFDCFRQGFARDVLQLTTSETVLRQTREWEVRALPLAQEKLAGLERALNRFRATTPQSGGAFQSGAPVLIRPAIFLFVFAEALTNSFMPLYALELYHPIWNLPKEIVLGLPISSFMLLTSIGLPFAGALSDAIGRKKALMLGALITSVSLVFCATAKGILALVVFRAAVGLGFGMTYISAQGYIIDTSSEAGRGEGMAIFLAALYGGSLCGTVIGGLIAERLGYRALFLLGALASFVSLLFLLIFIHELPSIRPGAKEGRGLKSLFANTKAALPSPREAWRLFLDRDFSSLVFFQAIPSKIVLIGLVFYSAPLMLKEFGNSPSDIGRWVIGYSLVMILLSQPVSRWCQGRLRTARFVLWGGVASGLVLLPLFYFASTAVVASAIVLVGLAHTLAVSNQDKLASQLRAVQQLGVGPGLGLYRQSERMGNVLAPLVLAGLTAAYGYGRALGIVGICVVISSLLFWLGYRDERKS